MCDCYMHRCEFCNEKIPFHIGDFKFPREDFKVYCQNHVNQAPKGAIIFKLVKNWDDFDEEYTVGWSCAIWGPEVGKINNGDNHPNIAADFKEVIIS